MELMVLAGVFCGMAVAGSFIGTIVAWRWILLPPKSERGDEP